tara:strand:- start:1230 stop:1649 length:420 start_codon:yes stop_codon:yes gene_type:complete
MKNEYLQNIKKNNSLFKNCISCNAPPGYNSKIKDFVMWLEEFNKKNKSDICITQIKMKFGFLTIYVEDAAISKDEKHPVFGLESDLVHKVYEKIAELCYEVQQICNVCGKPLVETVRDSKIVMICFDHFKQNFVHFRRR